MKLINRYRWVALAFLLLGNLVHAQNPWKINIATDGIYDNNILNYSQYDIQRFQNDTELHRSVIHTFDDFIFRGNVEVEYLARVVPKHPIRARFTFRNYAYTVNGIKDYQLYRFDVRYNTHRRNYITADYRLIPRYYLRHYIDRDRSFYLSSDNGAYLPCTFRLQQMNLGYTHYWKNTFFTSLGIEGNWLWYNQDFTEYDTNTLGLQVESFYFLKSWIKLGLQYQYTIGDNVGQDASRPSGDSDLSYTQHEVTWKLRTDINNIVGWRDLGLNIDIYERLRNYTSDAPPEADVFHSGRRNWRHRYAVSLSMDVAPYLDAVLRYEYEDRIVNSEFPIVLRLKEYSTTTISVGLEYALRW